MPPPYARMIAMKPEAGARASTIVSVAFQIGLAAYHRERLYDIERADAMAETKALALAGKVEIVADESLLEFFPANFPAEVEVTADGKTLRKRVTAATGDPGRQLDDAALADKAKRILGRGSGRADSGRPGRLPRAKTAASGSPTRSGKRRWIERGRQRGEGKQEQIEERAEEADVFQRRAQGGDRRSRRRQPHPLQRGHRRRLRPHQRPRSARSRIASCCRGRARRVSSSPPTSWNSAWTASRSGTTARPIYSERFIHSEIYKARPDVNSVVHSHSPTVVPFSVTNQPFLPIRAGFLYPEVPVFDTRDAAGWTDLLISNPMLGKALAEKLGNNTVVLLRGHGNAVVAPSVRVAVYRAVYTEANAKLLLQAKLLGGPIKYLAPEEAAIMNAARAKVRPGHGSDRIWELLKSEAMGTSGKRQR